MFANAKSNVYVRTPEGRPYKKCGSVKLNRKSACGGFLNLVYMNKYESRETICAPHQVRREIGVELTQLVVDLKGIEPSTSALRTQRSPS